MTPAERHRRRVRVAISAVSTWGGWAVHGRFGWTGIGLVVAGVVMGCYTADAEWRVHDEKRIAAMDGALRVLRRIQERSR